MSSSSRTHKAATRHPVVPEEAPPLVVDNQVVSPGVSLWPFSIQFLESIEEKIIVTLSTYTINFSKALWGEGAHTFYPERWTEGKDKGLQPHLHSFSKCTRQCIGIK